MDEPTEGLAPMIVAQVRDLLLRARARRGSLGPRRRAEYRRCHPCSDHVAIMVNGRINRVMDAARTRTIANSSSDCSASGGTAMRRKRKLWPRRLGDDRGRSELMQGVAFGGAGRAGDGEREGLSRRSASQPLGSAGAPARTPVAETATDARPPMFAIPFAERIGRTALVVGTFDTKGAELSFIRDRLRALNIPMRTVDFSTSGKLSPRGRDADAGRGDASGRLRRGVLRRPRRFGHRHGRSLRPLDRTGARHRRRHLRRRLRRHVARDGGHATAAPRHPEDHGLYGRLGRGRRAMSAPPTS